MKTSICAALVSLFLSHAFAETIGLSPRDPRANDPYRDRGYSQDAWTRDNFPDASKRWNFFEKGIKSTGSVETVTLNGQKFKGFNKSEVAVAQWICARSNLKHSFCSAWPKIDKLIDAAAQNTGYPSSLLKCLYLQESGYKTQARSHAGASGLGQFMPATARDLDRAVDYNSRLKGMLKGYQEDIGPNSDFNSKAMRGHGGMSTIDTQIIATPLYFRHYNQTTEDDWANILSKDSSQYEAYVAYQLASYNAGPGSRGVRQILKDAKAGRKFRIAPPMVAETRGYVRNILACMRDSDRPRNPQCNQIGSSACPT